MSIIKEMPEPYWTMHWTATDEKGNRVFPDKPDQEVIFEPEKAVAVLLANEIMFLNTHWWEQQWTEKAKKTIALLVICNDVFDWACADAQEIHLDEIQELYDMFIKDPGWGSAVWCMKKRNLMPQKPVYDDIKKEGIWDLDSMNLRPNA
jgi:hypothetical protein